MNNKTKLKSKNTYKNEVENFWKMINDHNQFITKRNIMDLNNRLSSPDNVVKFDVEWTDDAGRVQLNKGYRVQYNNILGPYKGGLRFHPSVNEDILKALAFEQVFKNSLTGLDLGGAKGGSDFDPKGKSDAEIERFCKAFMQQLYKHIGPDQDVPAGDIGVGGREIEVMYNEYVKLTGKHDCALTGKPLHLGGSLVRKEATGYGLIYFVNEYLKSINDNIEGKRILASGSGNVAIYAAEKAIEKGAIVLTMSDSDGFIYDKNGINTNYIKEIKETNRGRISDYLNYVEGADYFDNKRPWDVEADIALPCATQNEIEINDSHNLINNSIWLVAEGSNIPTTPEAIELFKSNNVIHLPSKAANAGGVAVSGLEMIQNAKNESWSYDDVDTKLLKIMTYIFRSVDTTAKESNITNNYLLAANLTALKRLINS